MNDINKIKIGCGAVLGLLCLAFYLVPLWYGRERSQEDLDKETLSEIKKDVQKAEKDLDEAAAALSRQEYNDAYQKAMYSVFGVFSTYSRGLSFELAPGRTVQQWLTEKKDDWRKKVNEEFDSQVRIFDGLKDPDAILAVGDRLQQLSDNYRTEYKEIYEKYLPKQEEIKKVRIAVAGITIYIDIRNSSYADSPFFRKLQEQIKKSFLSKWDKNSKYRLSFVSAWQEEKAATPFGMEVELTIVEEQYVSSKHKQPVSIGVPKTLVVVFKPFSGAKAKTSWNSMLPVRLDEECPSTLSGYEELEALAASHEGKMVKGLSEKMVVIPAFTIEAPPPETQKAQARPAASVPVRTGTGGRGSSRAPPRR